MAHQGPSLAEAGLDLEVPAAQAAVSVPLEGALAPNGSCIGEERDLGEQFPPCTHYDRHCALVSPCCGKAYICRFCHNDAQPTHELNRHAVTEVECLACHARQPVVPECLSCGASFGRYFCEICRMYDDREKQQFHCDACGICRVGGRENFFHCPKCDMCLGKDLEGMHQCVERVTHSNCSICLEDLHTSTSNLNVLRCGHITHHACWKSMMQKGIFSCPLCGQSATDMHEFWLELDRDIAATPMPEEYRDLKVWILCKDCHKTTETVFHVLGLRCNECGSYNTCRTGNPDPTKPSEAAAADTQPDTSL